MKGCDAKNELFCSTGTILRLYLYSYQLNHVLKIKAVMRKVLAIRRIKGLVNIILIIIYIIVFF